MTTTVREAKSCAVCGRSIEWRKKWARDWENVRYCSDACRGNKMGDLDKALQAAILELLAQRGAGKTICPSEAARRVAPGDWEPLMERTRAAARRLVATGEIVITQGGVVVDPSRAKGAIRLRRN
jgi:hypothetical protein